MLRIAVPNKGSLSEPAVEMLREAGYRQRRDSRELVLADPDNDVEFFFLRPRDIAVYVGSGTVDVGVTGRDLLLDSGADAVEHMQLGFGGSTFRYAAPAGTVTSLEQVQGLRVATSYEVLVEGHLRSHGVEATVVRKHSEGTGPNGEPTIVELITRGEVDMVINTPSGQGARADGYEIRAATTAADKAIVTTIQQLSAAVQAIEAVLAGPFEVQSLQEHMAALAESSLPTPGGRA